MKKRKFMSKILSGIMAIVMMFSVISGTSINAKAVNVESIIIDNTEAETQGKWSVGSGRAGKYGSNYGVGARDNTGNTSMTWRPTINTAGTYNVYYMQPDGRSDSQSIASNALYTIAYSSGVENKRVNQRVEGGEWVLLGTYYFDEGTEDM